MVKYSFKSLFDIVLLAWVVQTSMLAIGIVLQLIFQSDTSKDSISEIVITIAFYADLIVFTLMFVWSILELIRRTENSPNILGLLLIAGGTLVFMTAAIAYRTLLQYFPPNPIADYFTPIYNMTKVDPEAFIDLSVISNVLNGIVVANSALLTISLGYLLIFSNKTAKIMIILYGILNLLSTIFFFLIPFKPIIVLAFLLIAYLNYNNS